MQSSYASNGVSAVFRWRKSAAEMSRNASLKRLPSAAGVVRRRINAAEMIRTQFSASHSYPTHELGSYSKIPAFRNGLVTRVIMISLRLNGRLAHTFYRVPDTNIYT